MAEIIKRGRGAMLPAAAVLLAVALAPTAAQDCETGRCDYYQAQAAAECPSTRMGEEGRDKASRLSTKVLLFLEESDDDVVFLARAGSDAPSERFERRIGKDGTWNYTHGGLAFREHPGGQWTVVQLLNVCGELGGVFNESLEEFFLDNPWEYRAVAAAPSKELQAALAKVIIESDAAGALHSGAVYSSISHPLSMERQNSNEYILDIFAAAYADLEGRGINNRQAAKNYFLSSEHLDKLELEMIQAGMLERLAFQAGWGPDNATLDDHPPQSRAAGEFEFVSAGTLIQFLNSTGHLLWTEQFEIADKEKAEDSFVVEP